MDRIFAIIFNLIAALGINSVFQEGVSLDMQVPTEVVAGAEFEVRVNIKKGDLESFSRLQQDLPAGLTAISYITSNADFSFEEKRVRMIWLKLPQQEEFAVVYKIKVDERLKGTFNINGKFSYIEENERKSISIVSQPVNISPSPTIDPSLIVDIKDFEQQVIPYLPAVTDDEMACIRQIPSQTADGGYVVNILVNKASKQKFAKIEEAIPSGYKAVNIDPKEAIFTFKGNMAKFLWMNLPADPFFVVSYKLMPQDAQTGKNPSIKGKFSYLEGEKTVSLDIRQTQRDLASITPDEIPQLIKESKSALLAQADVKKTEEKEKEITEKKVSDVEAIKTTKEEKKEKKIAKATAKKDAKELKKNLPYILEPEEGVYFRVQLAAVHNTIDIQRYFKKYNLEKDVRKESHEGWQKYSIGSFKQYKEARDYRVHVWNTTAIDDAFVSAYNTGQRITVQEALMIGNQEWYK
jgi:hypothetical protein